MLLQGFREMSAICPGGGVSPQLAIINIINKKQVGRSVPDVFMISTQGTSRLHRNIGLRGRERLNLSLLIEAEERFPLGSEAFHTLVVPEYAGSLLFEVRGHRMFPVEDAVGLKVHVGENQMKRGVMNLGRDPFRKDLILQITKGPTQQGKTVFTGRATCKGNDLRYLQRGKNGSDYPLAVHPIKPRCHVFDNVGRPSTPWCGHDPPVRLPGMGANPRRTVTGYVHDPRPGAPSFRFASVSPGFRCARQQEQVWWVLALSCYSPSQLGSPIAGRIGRSRQTLRKNVAGSSIQGTSNRQVLSNMK